MRDSIFNKENFVEQIENFITTESQKRIETLRSHVIDSPNFLSENYLVLPYKLKSILALSFFSWWLPEEIGVLLREEIYEKRLRRYSLEDKALIEQFLQSKYHSILFVEESNLWHSRDFFGNFLVEGNKCLERLRFRRINTKVIYPKRKRGYDDHGSRVPDSKWLPKYDYSLTELQNSIEEERKTQEDSVAMMKGFLE